MRISDWSSDVCSSDLWIRSLDLDLADRQWRRRRVRDDDDGAAADDDMSALRDSLKRMPQPRPVAIPENRPAPVIADRQLSPSAAARPKAKQARSEEHTSELQSLMRISYAVFCLKKKRTITNH